MAEILGIMITKYENLDHIAAVTKAARKAGKSVMIFMTDEAVRFTRDPKFLELRGPARSFLTGASIAR